MKRRNFIHLAGLGIGGMALAVPVTGASIPAEALLAVRLDQARKKALADVALNTARSNGASYADVRIGRYLNQYLFTRENKVQNIVNRNFNTLFTEVLRIFGKMCKEYPAKFR